MTINVNAITDVLRDRAPQDFADATSQREDMLQFTQEVNPSSPNGPTWRVKISNNASGGTFAEGGTFPAGGQYEFLKATLGWGRYVATLEMTGDVEDQLMLSDSLFIDNYFNTQLDDALESLLDDVNTDLLGGANTNGVTGITAAIDDSGTYAGISRSTYPIWSSYCNDNSGTPRALTIALMKETHRQLVDVRKGQYDVILCSQDQFDAYTALTVDTPALRAPVNTNALQGITFNAGAVAAGFRGRPLLVVPGYDATRMDFVQRRRWTRETLRAVRVSDPKRVNDDWHWDITFKLQAKLFNPRKNAASIQDLS